MDRYLPPGAHLIPEDAKLVFEGIIFDTYQWTEYMFDSRPLTFEMLRRPDTVKIIAVDNGKLVVIEDEQPSARIKTTFPGGRVEETDGSWLNAAKRELLEETGLSFNKWKLVEVVQPVRKIEWFVAWYIASELKASVDPSTDSGENIVTKRYEIDECFSKVFSKTNPEAKYLPDIVKPGRTLGQLLNAEAING